MYILEIKNCLEIYTILKKLTEAVMTMHKIRFNNKDYNCRNNETVLEALHRQGVELSFSCRKGSCQVCMLKCDNGSLPDDAQNSLKELYISKNYFLPCICKPVNNLEISEIDRHQLFSSAMVYKKEFLSKTVCKLLIESDKITEYKPGQFINICRPDGGGVRSYSLASCQANDYYLELHIQLMENGELSQWIFNELEEGDLIDIQGPNGHCYYQQDNSNSPVLLVGTGTGAAPLTGILRDAMDSKHQGEIHIFHEARSKDDLYMHGYLTEISQKNSHIFYYPCVPGASLNNEIFTDSARHIITDKLNDFSGWLVYLAGSDTMVSKINTYVTSHGADANRVFSDSFDLKDLRENSSVNDGKYINRNTDNKDSSTCLTKEVSYPEPDAEIWAELEQGKKLTRILTDFYNIVYKDEKLSPFFSGITQQRSIEKVYLFLRQIFTGEKVYIGDRPRNAHHWMVISDELFDYREDIMMSCLRKHNIPEHLILRWREMEESFRPDIVKEKPWNKVINGIEMPVEGFEELELDSGTLCDSCHGAIEAGEKVRYHVRLGTVYCPNCISTNLTSKTK